MLKYSGNVIPFRRVDELTLNHFIRLIDRKNFRRAARLSSELFLLGDELADEVVERYLIRRAQNPELHERLKEFDVSLQWGDLEEAMDILEDTFGVRGMDGIWMIQAYQRQRERVPVTH